MSRHGDYQGVAGWFAVSEPPGSTIAAISGADLQRQAPETDPAANPTPAARTLCRIADTYGIDCAVVPQSGRHDWPFAARAFATSLPWLAAQIGTPAVPDVALPGPRSPGVR
jgi:S-formylglutathione hydrolase FrmB